MPRMSRAAIEQHRRQATHEAFHPAGLRLRSMTYKTHRTGLWRAAAATAASLAMG